MPQIALGRIKLDQRAQSRAVLRTDVVNEYADAMRAGAVFPPLTVFDDGKVLWLGDGFHRHPAAVSAGLREFPCTIMAGGLRDAILHSCKVNAAHGLRRSDEDKRRAVKVLLDDAEWSGWSDREIARRCEVSHEFVRKLRGHIVRKEESANSGEPHLSTLTDGMRKVARRGGTYEMKTASIGKRETPSSDARKLPKSAPVSPSPDEVAHHAAVTVLARSIADVRATAAEIVAGCADDEDREDLREACGGALAKVSDVLAVLSEQRREAA